MSPIVTPPSDVAGSSSSDSQKKPQKRPAEDSQKKPQKRLKFVRGKPIKQPKRAPAAKKPKKSKDPELSTPELSLPSSSGIPSTSLLPQPEVTPPQLSIPTASPQLPVANASPQVPVPNATQTPPPDNPKNAEGKRKDDYEKILMNVFIEPEY